MRSMCTCMPLTAVCRHGASSAKRASPACLQAPLPMLDPCMQPPMCMTPHDAHARQAEDDTSSLNGSMTAPPPPSAHDQAEEVEAAEQGPLSEGDTVFLVTSSWWDGWCSYTGYEAGAPAAAASSNAAAAGEAEASAPPAEASPPPAPGIIDNRPLLEAPISSSSICSPVLKRELEEGRDYVVVRAGTWKLLRSWYGGGPVIERTVVLEGPPNSKKPRINLIPMRLEVWCYNERTPKYLEADSAVSCCFPVVQG